MDGNEQPEGIRMVVADRDSSAIRHIYGPTWSHHDGCGIIPSIDTDEILAEGILPVDYFVIVKVGDGA